MIAVFCLFLLTGLSCGDYCNYNKVCTKLQYYQEKYEISCNFWYWGVCSRYRTKQRYVQSTCVEQGCCPNYIGSDCSQALCNGVTTCQNGGNCTSPNYCICPEGFSSPVCNDTDECMSNNGGCDQNCTNLFGSFECSCNDGFHLGEDNKTCIDINECLDHNGGCSQICNNIPGSYECLCNAGMELSQDGMTCQDIDECLINNGGCDHVCVNEIKSYRCECNSGYQKGKDGKSCEDIDECQNKLRCSHICLNTNGSYVCSCHPGYQLSNDGTSCIDSIDDCIAINCSNGGLCIDKINSYSCKCKEGFEGTHCEKGNSTDTSAGMNIFEVHKIPRNLLPKGCATLELASCGAGSSDRNVLFSSTSDWFRLSTNSSIFFTHGIVFIETGDFALPLSISGLTIFSTSTGLELVFGSLSYKENNGIKLTDTRGNDCYFFQITPKDMYVLMSSYLPTVFEQLFHVIPEWIKFSKSGSTALSIRDLKTDLMHGYELDDVHECKGAPLQKNNMYSVLRFGSGLSISIYGKTVHIPSQLSGNKICLIVDICENIPGTFYLLLPPESRDILGNFDIFKSLKSTTGLSFRPRGFGLSKSKHIDVAKGGQTQELELWNGENHFKYSVFPQANVWLSSDVKFTWMNSDLQFFVDGNTEIFIGVPTISTLITGFFVEEWNVLLKIRTNQPQFSITLLGSTYSLDIKLTSSLDAYLSIGGNKERRFCGESANPEGLFASFLLSGNPFRNVPILKTWRLVPNIRAFAFIPLALSTHDTNIDILEDITDLKTVIEQFGDRMTGITKVLEQQGLIAMKAVVTDLQNALHDMTNLTNEFYTSRNILVKHTVIAFGHIWNTFIRDIQSTSLKIIDMTEYEENPLAKSLSELLNNEISLISNRVEGIIEKLRTKMLSVIPQKIGFGLKFSANDIYLGKLGFGSADVEYLHDLDELEQCSKFKKAYEILKGHKTAKALVKLTISRRFNFFIRSEYGMVISIAFPMKENVVLFVAHFRTYANLLGIEQATDVIISNKMILMDMEGNIWDTYFAKYHLSAEIASDWSDLRFHVKGQFVVKLGEDDFGGSFLDGLLILSSKLADSANNRMNQAIDSLSSAQSGLSNAQSKISEAQEKVNGAHKNFDSAVSAMNVAKRKLEDAKGPFQHAIDQLNKAQKNVDNLCKIRTCAGICVGGLKWVRCGWGWCLSWTNCLFRVPDIPCHLANAACHVVRSAAYVALEAAKLFVKAPMLALDIAKSAISAAQFVVDKSRVVLDIANGVLEVAKIGLETAKWILEAAKFAVEGVKFLVKSALYVFDLIVKYGLNQLIDVRNCKFELQITTTNPSFFDVSCEVQAFHLNWHTIKFEFDFRHPFVSMLKIVQSTVSTLFETVGDMFGKRKRRDFSFKSMATLHHIVQIHKRSIMDLPNGINSSENLNPFGNNFTLIENTNINFKNRFKDRVEYFTFQCRSFLNLHSFFFSAIDLLTLMTNESTKAIDDAENNFQMPMSYNLSNFNFSTVDFGINKDYALKTFNLSSEQIDAALLNLSSSPFASDLFIMDEITIDLYNIMNSQQSEAKSMSVMNDWELAMGNITKDYFNESDCIGYEDCVIFAFLQLHDVFSDDSIKGIATSRDVTTKLEVEFLELLRNDSWTIKESNQKASDISKSLVELNRTNIWYSTPPKFTFKAEKKIVLEGSVLDILCAVSGHPKPNVRWYFNNSKLLNATEEHLIIEAVQTTHKGIYRCEAENIVANRTSEGIEVDVLECLPGAYYKLNKCEPCPIGYYQEMKNQLSCVQCGDGYKTELSGSKMRTDCIADGVSNTVIIAACVSAGSVAILSLVMIIHHFKKAKGPFSKVRPMVNAELWTTNNDRIGFENDSGHNKKQFLAA